MIDYFALALGHGLLVLAFMRLVMRDSLDVDPAISELKEVADAKRPNPRGQKQTSKLHQKDRKPQSVERARPEHQSLSAQKAARRAGTNSAPCSETQSP